MKPLAIEALELTHYYNDHPAVDHVSFGVEAGTIFGLLGPNGAGKSTTIKMLTTLLAPTSGTATVRGYDIEKQAQDVRQRIGYVPQLFSADGDLTGYENLLLSAKLYGLTRQHREKQIQETLEFMGISDVADELVNKYSGGMIRRLEIAQALVHRPEVLFLDEPTSGLDPSARKTLWTQLKKLREQGSTTILLTTHDMEEADALCDVVAFMKLGSIVALDTPTRLKGSLGPNASLDDAFIHFSGSSLTESGDYSHARQIRKAISRHR